MGDEKLGELYGKSVGSELRPTPITAPGHQTDGERAIRLPWVHGLRPKQPILYKLAAFPPRKGAVYRVE